MQANGRPATVLIISPQSRYDERFAAGVIKPGHLIEYDSDGKVVVNPTAADVNAPARFATEERLVLEGKTIADSYAVDDVVGYREFLPGDKVQAWLGTGANVAIGAKLESAGNGELQVRTTGRAVAEAAEAVDATAAAKQILVTIL